GQGLIEGRALVDNVMADDRTTVVRLWLQVQEEGAGAGKGRMLRRSSTRSTPTIRAARWRDGSPCSRPVATNRRAYAASARTGRGCGWTPRCATTSTTRDATTCWWS